MFAELERKLTAERVFATMLSRASKGLFNGGIAPFGYKSPGKGKFPVVDHSEAPTVKLIFDLYEQHKSTHKVSEILDDMGIKTRRGNSWGYKALTEIIRNPFYKGTYRYNYREMATPSKSRKPQKEWLLVEDTHEPIISNEQWDRVNEIMQINSEKNTSRFRKSDNIHLFAGLVKCSACGRNMTAQSAAPRKDGYTPSKYRCVSRSFNAECSAKVYSTIDDKIGKTVFQSIADIAQGKKILTVNRSELIEYTIDDKTVEVSFDFVLKEIEKYNNALIRLNDLYIFSGMSEKDYLLKKSDIESKLKELKKKKPATPKKIDDDFLKMASYFLINNEFMNKRKVSFRTIVDNVDKKILKDFLNQIIFEIKVRDGKVESITYANGATIVFTE